MSSAILRSSIGDLAILAGSLHEPARGRWVAVVEVHAATEPDVGSDASIIAAAEDGSTIEFVGRVRKRARSPGRVALSCTVVGASKMSAELDPRDHQRGAAEEIPAGLVARGICDDAGEALADGVEDALDAMKLPHWTRVRGTADDALDVLAHITGRVWRAQRGGKIWIGEETWPEAETPRTVARKLEDGTFVHAPDGAEIAPGTTVAGRRIDSVDHFFGGPVRAEARERVEGDPRHAPDLTLYRQIYGARVVSQDATTHELELVPDDARLGDSDHPLRGIPLRIGIPGARATVPAGARVRVAFESGDPRKPFAFGFDEDTAANATKSFAMVGDTVRVGTLEVNAPPGGGPCTITFTPAAPGGLASTGLSMGLGGYVLGNGHEYVKGNPL